MAASLASPRPTRTPYSSAPCSSSRFPESSFKITPYGHKSSYPYGHYQRPVNYEGPLDDVKQKIRASRDHSRVAPEEEDDYSGDSGSDGELDESPRRHKVKKLGVL